MDWKESIVENLMKINEGFVLFSHNSKPENGFCGKAVTHQHSVYAKLLIEHHWTTICLLESIYNISGFLLRIGHIAILDLCISVHHYPRPSQIPNRQRQALHSRSWVKIHRYTRSFSLWFPQQSWHSEFYKGTEVGLIPSTWAIHLLFIVAIRGDADLVNVLHTLRVCVVFFFFKRGSCFQFQVNLVDLMDLLCCTSRCVECAKGGQWSRAMHPAMARFCDCHFKLVTVRYGEHNLFKRDARESPKKVLSQQRGEYVVRVDSGLECAVWISQLLFY